MSTTIIERQLSDLTPQKIISKMAVYARVLDGCVSRYHSLHQRIEGPCRLANGQRYDINLPADFNHAGLRFVIAQSLLPRAEYLLEQGRQRGMGTALEQMLGPLGLMIVEQQDLDAADRFLDSARRPKVAALPPVHLVNRRAP